MVLTGLAIIPQLLENFKARYTQFFLLVYRVCSLVDPIFQAIWAYQVSSFLYNSTSLECGIHSLERIVILEAQNASLGYSLSKFRMLLDRQFTFDTVSFIIFTLHLNKQVNTVFQL